MTDLESVQQARAIVDASVGPRLEGAGTPPELLEAVIDGIAARIGALREKSREQIENLRSPSSSRVPDAYLFHHEEAENELQKVGAGIRTALALGGNLVDDPFALERNHAADLSPSGTWALRNEASRVPRPVTRPPVFAWSHEPIPWVGNSDAGWPPKEVDALAGVRQPTGTDALIGRVVEAPYSGWVQLGLIERQRTLASRHPQVPARQFLLMAGLEVCDGSVPANSVPLSSVPPVLWELPHTEIDGGLSRSEARHAVSAGQNPLVGVVRYGREASRESGLGLHPFCLSPRLDAVALLDLRPEAPALRHVLVDDQGPGLVCRQWRSFLVHDGDYEPLEPAVQGADLIVRPDLYEALESAVGHGRITLGIHVSSSSGEG